LAIPIDGGNHKYSPSMTTFHHTRKGIACHQDHNHSRCPCHSNTVKRPCDGSLRHPLRFVFKVVMNNRELASIGGGGTSTRNADIAEESAIVACHKYPPIPDWGYLIPATPIQD
jgi:hypothetical protein